MRNEACRSELLVPSNLYLYKDQTVTIPVRKLRTAYTSSFEVEKRSHEYVLAEKLRGLDIEASAADPMNEVEFMEWLTAE